MPNNKFFIINDKGGTVCEAIGDKYARGSISFTNLSKNDIQKIVEMKHVRFRKQEPYAELFSGEVSSAQGRGFTVMNIVNLSEEKRADLKLRVNFKSILSLLSGREAQVYSVRILDLSCSGARFLCRSLLDKEMLYELVVPLQPEAVVVNVQVLRQESYEGRDFYSYGARFVDIDSLQETVIREALFHIQIMNEKRR